MAFRQPTAAPQRQSLAVDRHSQSSKPRVNTHSRPVDDTQEWVLFSPSHAQTESYISTERTPRTNGISRLSDFGSWNTGAQSADDEGLEQAHEAEDADDLDSLDDGLQAFREPATDRRLDQSGGAILPAHDGLGGFPASSPPVQEHLFNFELYNKQRRQSYGHHRTTSSIQRQLESLDNDTVESSHLDWTRRERIEKWRLDSSRIISEELEKEAQAQSRRPTTVKAGAAGDVAKLSSLIESHLQGTAAREGENDGGSAEDESLWQRITRRVVEDLIGIDDTTLAIILGESLPEHDELSTTPTAHSSFQQQPAINDLNRSQEGWQNFLISRLAREIGMLASYFSGSTIPGQANDESLSSTMEYAGIPVTESTVRSQMPSNDESAQFLPTIRNRHFPINRTTSGPRSILNDPKLESQATPIAEVDYWERTPDLRAVFNYLSQRFMSRRYSSSAPTTSNIATTHTENSLNRAAIIQKHHPLISRTRANAERRGRRSSFRLSSQLGNRSVAYSPSLKRAGTSCASWSTKRHRMGASENASRNYWDIGGSIGSENAAWGGVWGEV